MVEPGVGARVDEAVNLGLERWDPVRIVLVEGVSDVDEGLSVGGVLDGADRKGHGTDPIEAGLLTIVVPHGR